MSLPGRITILLVFLCLLFATTFSVEQPLNSRIIGGEPAKTGDFPFAAAIYITTSDGTYFCGGTLLTSQWVLTAGQCVNGANTFTIQLGTNDLNGNDTYTVKVSSDTYILHPNYNSVTLDNDVGLIQLRMPVEFSDYLKPVDLLPLGTVADYTTFTAIGWGHTSDNESGLAEKLQSVLVWALSDEECKTVYGNQITENMVCAHGIYNEGTCIGDSGSPLTRIVGRSYTVVEGVSSFHSSNGCESTDPSGYTKIYQYNEWIQNITGRTK